MRVVVTGPTGSVGVALVKYFLREGAEVVAICRRNSKRIGQLPKHDKLKIVERNLDELQTLSEEDLGRCDLLYHLGWAATMGAGRNDMDCQIQNIGYTMEAVRLAARLHCETFVGTGSQAEYGRSDSPIKGSTPTFPENGYGMAKLCAGQMSRVECEKFGIRHEWTRILSVYGPNDNDNTLVMSLIRKLLAHERCALTKGEQMWDYLYCDDAARALGLVGTKGIHGKTYCVGSGEAKPLAEYITQIRDVVNPDGILGLGDVPYGDKQVMFLQADIAELTEDTGFVPEVSFGEGIAKTLAWVKGENNEEN